MAKVTRADLANVPNQWLYEELVRRSFDKNSDVFAVNLWVREDVETIVDDADDLMGKSATFMGQIDKLGWKVMSRLANEA